MMGRVKRSQKNKMGSLIRPRRTIFSRKWSAMIKRWSSLSSGNQLGQIISKENSRKIERISRRSMNGPGIKAE